MPPKRPPRPPKENALVAAVLAAMPLPPPQEWMTIQEIMAAADPPLSVNQAHKRVQILTGAGKLERMKGPRRGDGMGVATYYRLKK